MVLGETFYDLHVVSASGGQIVNSLGMHVETKCGDDSRVGYAPRRGAARYC
jgi:hypothetical protein